MSELGELTFLEVDGLEPVLIVPLGSTEQHGPHLPLDTDTRIACALANHIASQRSRTVVAPAISIGASGEHQGFAGTLSLGTEVLTEVLVELVRSAREWATGVMFVCGHGGNLEAVNLACDRSRSEGDHVALVTAGSPGADLHAGRAETSLLLYLSPGLVGQTEGVKGASGTMDELGSALRTHGVASVSPNGILGDPEGASASEGEERFTYMCAAALREFDRQFAS